jgi:LysM repeat protein
MDCQDARRLIDRGVKPGTADVQRSNLGFHLARCAPCHAYRRDVEALQVLSAMLAQPVQVAHAAPPVRRWQMALRPARAATVALMITGALAVLPSAGLLTTTVSAAQASDARSAAMVRTTNWPARRQVAVFAKTRDELPAPRPALIRTTTTDSLLRDLLEAPPPQSEMQIMLDQRRAAAAAERVREQTLLRDLLLAPPSTGEMRGVLDQARAAAAAEALAQQQAALPLETGTAELALGQELSLPPLPTAASSGWDAPTYAVADTYVVQPGDSLWAIAERYYGNGALWPAIYHANADQIGDPDLIYPNQQFDIPAQPVWSDQFVVYHPRRRHYNSDWGGGGYHSAWAGGDYTIVSGDTLSDIAYRVYGNANRWHEIYDWNQGAIGCDPDLIYPGTVLSLPPA